MAVDQQDILMGSDFDLLMPGGDIVYGDSVALHQKNILLASKGSYKQSPLVGVDMFMWLNDERPEDMMREIRLQFTKDGMTVKRLSITPPSQVAIDADYE